MKYANFTWKCLVPALVLGLIGTINVTRAESTPAGNNTAGEANADAPRILIVVTSHEQLGNTGKQTGYYLSEVSHPWHVFTEAGFTVDFASPQGGNAPVDPKSLNRDDPINAAFLDDERAAAKIADTLAPSQVDPEDYAAIFFAGGHGTMWDFPDHEKLQHLTATIYQQRGVVGAVCHGPAALVNVRLKDGRYLVEGQPISAFTNEEEAAVGLTETMPFLLETRLRERGARFSEAEPFEKQIAIGDRLVTGQNPASATATAEAIVKQIKSTRQPAH